MEISLVSGDKLKISLTQLDFEQLGISYSSMDYADKATKRALIRLLEKAKREVGFSPRGAKLFVEVYQTDDGCELYFTCIRKAAALPELNGVLAPALFEFANVNDLIAAAVKTHARYGHRIYKSALYLMDGKYRLLIYNLDYSDKLSIYFLSEFGRMLGDNEMLAAHTMEHGAEIIPDTALEMLARLFG